jgi:hypothetical protein
MRQAAGDLAAPEAIDELIAAVQANRDIRRQSFLEGRAPVVRLRKGGLGLPPPCDRHDDDALCPYECSVDDEPVCARCAIDRVASGEYAVDVESFANVIGRWVLEGSYP